LLVDENEKKMLINCWIFNHICCFFEQNFLLIEVHLHENVNM